MIDNRVMGAARELAAALAGATISYALIGGLAVGVRSRPRATRDVDILIQVPQIRLPGLLRELTDRGFTIDESRVIEQYVRHHLAFFEYQGVRIDWLKPLVPCYQHVLESANTTETMGCSIRVASGEGLILLKLIAARTQDYADIETLLAANRNQLDLPWVEREWLTLFALDDPRWLRYQQAIAEYYQYPRHS